MPNTKFAAGDAPYGTPRIEPVIPDDWGPDDALDELIADEKAGKLPRLTAALDAAEDGARPGDSDLGGAVRLVRATRAVLVGQSFALERIDGLEHLEHDGRTAPFMAFRWTLDGATEVWPATPMHEAFLIVLTGAVRILRGDAADTVVEEGQALWLCGEDENRPFLPALNIIADAPARGLIIVWSKLGVPFQDTGFVAAAKINARAKVQQTTLNLDGSGKGGAWAEDIERVFEPSYPHQDAINLGNIVIAEARDWRALRQANDRRKRSHLICRSVALPPRERDSDVSLAIHSGVEVILPLFGVTACYFARPGVDEQQSERRLMRDYASTLDIGRIHRWALVSSAAGARDEDLLVVHSSEVLHGFCAAPGAQAGLLMFGAGNTAVSDAWRALALIIDDAGDA